MSFSQIRGQDKVIGILQGYIGEARLTGGYLFSGPQGVGKKFIATTLAKAVNCESLSLDSCDHCPSCLKIDKAQHPDVSIVDFNKPITENVGREQADSNAIRIGHIRSIQHAASLRPYEGRKKVFIIDGAHNLTAEAANAFLKILEEPPRDTLLILITHKQNRIFKTIISRCKQVKFSLLPRDELEIILKEEHAVSALEAHFLAYFCEGRLGSALGLKDSQILKEKNSIIDRWGLLRRPRLDGFLLQNKEEARDFMNVLSSWFRDIYLLKIGMPHAQLVNLDRKEDLLKVMPRFTYNDLNEIFDFISSGFLYLEQNINMRLLLHNLEALLWKA
ncbi:MAG: DNA polymerase III subunit [Candidatus Omnitrophota bacterium]